MCIRDSGYAVEGGGTSTSEANRDSIVGVYHTFPVNMRATPTLTMLGNTNRGGASANAQVVGTQHFVWGRKKTGGSTGNGFAYASSGFKVDAEL